jgi:hypothetical protein
MSLLERIGSFDKTMANQKGKKKKKTLDKKPVV